VQAADENIQEVVVTGSRIAQPNLTTTSPVTQVTDKDIATQGVTRVEDLLNQLPQAFAAQNATVSNGSTGTATLDLRGLGSPRTLVLVDGRRLPYGGVTNSAADINQIPAAMIERVEVQTGGSSAVYGSDAVAGVVNFIMKKNFEGVQLDGQYGFYQHNNSFSGPGAVELRDVIAGRAAGNPSQYKLPPGDVTDGFSRTASVLMGVGTEDGRGNITAYMTYTDNDAVLERDRDFSACTLGTQAAGSFTCGGSDTSYPGLFTQDFATKHTIDGNNFRDYTANDSYNFGPLNYFQRPDTRYSIGANGHYELNEHADVYTQLMYTDIRSVAQIAPGGIFFNTGSINCDNPLMSAQQRSLLLDVNAVDANGDPDPVAAALPFCTSARPANAAAPLYIGRRNVEGGGRQADFHNTSMRALLGTRGTIVDGWDYDVSAQFSRVTTDQGGLNDFSVSRLTKALDVVTGDDGNPVCRSALPGGSDPNCVPLNIFAIGGVTPQALNYVQVPALQSGVIDQHVTMATVTGDLGTIGAKLPTAADPIKVVFGVENRFDKLVNVTDTTNSTADLAGAGGPTIGINGSTNVTDLFTEISIPLIQDKAFAKQVGIDAAYRYSDYGDLTTDTYKIGADWAPIEDIRFRGSYQKAVRAANIVELFTAQGANLFDLDGDPCGLKARNANATDAKCIASGVPASRVGTTALDSPAGQYNFIQGGNVNLQPEESETVSFGVVLTPSFAPGLSVSIDWFKITIDDTISTYGADNTLKACYNNDDAASCAKIHRNPIGQLWIGSGNVEDLNINIGSLETSGVDLVVNYASLDIGKAGSLSFNLTGSYLDKLVTDPGPGIDPYDCAGFFSSPCVAPNGAPKPKWRHLARIGWQMPWQNIDMALTWRYYGKVDQINAAATRIDSKWDAENYFDLFGEWAMTEKASVRLGVNNILDNDPSINATVGVTGNGNTYPQLYDSLGRFIFGGVTVKF
jgi:outer membrane receptor protein involved in Fe transport